MGNEFCWNELHSTDPDKSRSFFQQLFDWEFEDMDMNGQAYAFIKAGGEPRGGLMAQMQPGAPSAFLSYVLVDDLAAKTRQVEELGGTVLVAGQAAGEFGDFSVVQDPTGAMFALWQPRT